MALASNLAVKASEVFQLRLDDTENSFSVFDPKELSMDIINGEKHLFSHFANGIFAFKKDESGHSLLKFMSPSLNKFSIVFVIKIDGLWRYRGGIIATEDIGIIGYPLHTTFETAHNELSFPDKFNKNTVMIIGIETIKHRLSMSLKIFAEANYNDGPYFGEISWQLYRNDSNIVFSPSLLSANAVPRDYIQLDQHIKPLVIDPKPESHCVPKEKINQINLDGLPALPDTTDDEADEDLVVNLLEEKPLIVRKQSEVSDDSDNMIGRLRTAMRLSKKSGSEKALQ